MTKLKICGLKSREDIKAVNELKPAYAGFVTGYKKSPRNITAEDAHMLSDELDADIIPVGVFVDNDQYTVVRNADIAGMKIIQLHGHESNGYITGLRLLTDKEIWKAFIIKSAADIYEAENSAADMILLDAGRGSGKQFDHELLTKISRPFIIAGGIGPGNIRNIIEKYHPYCADASSSLETNGCKDIQLMKKFMDEAKKGNSHE
jgi:phosphoribosylanthranilate isomerase